MPGKILIVDDDSVMGELLIVLLGLKGYEVRHTHSAAEAMTMLPLHGQELDVVLSDIQMPGISGEELGRELNAARATGALRADALLLGMSGSRPSKDEASAFDGFVQKPFTTEELEAKIAEVRARRGQRTGGEPASKRSMSSSTFAPASGFPVSSAPFTASVPPLDERTFGQLRAKVGDEVSQQLYAMTLEDIRARLERMRAGASAGDAQTVRREAHTIKGSCGMVGALELQALAAATEGGSALDTSALADFAAACQRLERMLNERFQ